MSDRGMKKWAPYKSLCEQADSLQKVRNSSIKCEKPLISQEEAEEINRVLVNYSGEELMVKYYRNSKIYEEKIFIKRIDLVEKKLVLTTRESIKLNEIFSLKRLD